MLSYHGDSFSSEHTCSVLFHPCDCWTFHQASFSSGRWCKSSRCLPLSAQTSCRGHAPFRRPFKKTNPSQSETHLRPASQLSAAREEINNKSCLALSADRLGHARARGFLPRRTLVFFFFKKNFFPLPAADFCVNGCEFILPGFGCSFSVCGLRAVKRVPLLLQQHSCFQSSAGLVKFEGGRAQKVLHVLFFFFFFFVTRLTWLLTWQWFCCLY